MLVSESLALYVFAWFFVMLLFEPESGIPSAAPLVRFYVLTDGDTPTW